VQAMADVYTVEGSGDHLDALAWPLRASDAELQGLPPHGAHHFCGVASRASIDQR
jgi:hypothetical protein